MKPFDELDPGPDTLFYLRTTRRDICDITISGPFHNLEAIMRNLLLRLHETSS